jgi:hypothetical protein
MSDTYTVGRWKRTRFWGVFDAEGGLVCVCAYRKGALALRDRLDELMEGKGDPWR